MYVFISILFHRLLIEYPYESLVAVLCTRTDTAAKGNVKG